MADSGLTQDFSVLELQCKCGRWCKGLANFHPGFLDELQAVRTELNLPMRIRSACRCAKHNDTPVMEGGAGGHHRSLHVGDREQHPGQKGCLAVDVETLDGELRGKLFDVLWRRRWSIGWNGPKKFLHGDLRVLIGMRQTTFDYGS